MTEEFNHNLEWQLGDAGKGFILRPDEKTFPHLQGAQPIIWTWPTHEMRPTHSEMKQRSIWRSPQGMHPIPSTYFHITPSGGVRQFGGNRTLDDDEMASIINADPRLRPDLAPAPQVETDQYGHANRLLEILGAIRRGVWVEWPKRWRKR